jgi:quercetin dioxygenase-like cupin family protein
MIISSILEELESATHPVAKPLHKSENGRVLCIGFKKGMLLKEHKAHMPTTLVVLKGNVVFAIEGEKHNLSTYDEFIIPVEITHAVSALEDSLILLIQI